MNAEIKSVVSKYENFASHLLFRSPRNFVAIGNLGFDDVVIRGSIAKEFKDSVIFELGTKIEDSIADCDYLYKEIIKISDQGAVADFILSLADLKLIQFVVKTMSATHIRFYSESSSDQIRVSIFDIRKLASTHQLLRKRNIRLYTHKISGTVRSRFSSTIKATSFSLLKSSQTVTVSPNGITKFDNSDNNVQYLMRDQEIIEPTTTFISERLETNICFSFHPKSDSQDQHTNPPENLELESVDL